VGSTGQPLSSMMGKVDRESLAMATQFLNTVHFNVFSIVVLFNNN
jgi:hypothetical protein